MSRKPQTISGPIRKMIKHARVARLASLDSRGRPHIVPVCFAYDGKALYSAVDGKPKPVSPKRLVRLQNIRAASRVGLLIDEIRRGLDAALVCLNPWDCEPDSEFGASRACPGDP